MRIAVAVLLAIALSLAPHAQGVLGADGIYVLAETAPAPVGGTAAIADALTYPEAALDAGAEGVVVLMLVVAPDGSLAAAEVGRAPHPALGEAALAAVSSLAFTPGVVGGEPVATRLSLPVRFVLPEAEPEWADQPAEPIGGWNRLIGAVAWPASFFDDGRTVSFDLVLDVEPDGTLSRARVENIDSAGGRVVAVQRTVSREEAEMMISENRTRPPTERYADLREAILAATRAVRFTPEIRDGEAVASTVRKPWRRFLPGAGELPEGDAPAFPIGGWDRLIGSVGWPDVAVALEGDVTVAVDVDAEGNVTGAEIVESTLDRPEPGFEAQGEVRRSGRSLDVSVIRERTSGAKRDIERAILLTFERARFVPGIADGRPVPMRVLRTIILR